MPNRVSDLMQGVTVVLILKQQLQKATCFAGFYETSEKLSLRNVQREVGRSEKAAQGRDIFVDFALPCKVISEIRKLRFKGITQNTKELGSSNKREPLM